MRSPSQAVMVALGSLERSRPARRRAASVLMSWSLWRPRRARCGSSGLAQPWLWFHVSRQASKVFSWPGGAMFSALVVLSSILGTTKCSSTLPSWLWRTHRMSYCSRSRPAKAISSKLAITARSVAPAGTLAGMSPRSNAITPEVYRHLFGQASISIRVRSGSPASTSGAGVRVFVWPGMRRCVSGSNSGTTSEIT
jgi:hypothetical protein